MYNSHNFNINQRKNIFNLYKIIFFTNSIKQETHKFIKCVLILKC